MNYIILEELGRIAQSVSMTRQKWLECLSMVDCEQSFLSPG